jgi:ethanolamine ammonia-lyase small subunit
MSASRRFNAVCSAGATTRFAKCDRARPQFCAAAKIDYEVALMPDDPLQSALPDLLSRIRQRTPARVLVGRAGAAYRTGTQLDLREAHAAARDAVRTELDLVRDLGEDFVKQWNLFEVSTQASCKDEYLLRPDLGRRLSQSALEQISSSCPKHPLLQIIIGDGLSVTAVSAQVPRLLPLVAEQAASQLLSFVSPPQQIVGQAFTIHYCRVGVMNDLGELLQPDVVVLLIGERPGLATAESLSAYMAFRPRSGDTDAQRNLISNIHARGVPPEQAAERIVQLAAKMLSQKKSGTELKEDLPAPKWLRGSQ